MAGYAMENNWLEDGRGAVLSVEKEINTFYSDN